ncbi:MAG: polysaccharide biosynthesis protein [Alphaproteobacteria bacterium]
MISSFSLKRSYFVFAHDLIAAALSYIVSMYLKFGTEFSQAGSKNQILFGGLVFIFISIIVLYSSKIHRAIWKYISIKDLIDITKATLIIILSFIAVTFVVNRLENFSRAMLGINWMVLVGFLCGPRILYRVSRERMALNKLEENENKKILILLLGINNNTELFLRSLSRLKFSEYKVIGVLDYNDARAGSYIYNVKIYGDYKNLPSIYNELQNKNLTPQKIIITEDHIEGSVVRNIFKVADNLGMTIAKLPKLTDFRSTSQETIEIKPIVIEDLLGRAQNALDRDGIFDLINKKRVLVTGAGGTIGSELTRQIMSYDPSIMILIEHSEYNLYIIDKEVRTLYPSIKIRSILNDIRNEKHLDKIFKEERPEIVFHAAALKHVPLVEDNIVEAVSTNIIGTKNVADKSIEYNVEQMLLISTDKAVNPTSMMGVTKRIAENYIQFLGSNHETKFATVRFGNVLGSSGSVIPLFESQLKAGGPITITHPEMTRYFMTVREAVELVLQAALLARNSENNNNIFVLDMGEPIKIKDLALQMIKMAGLRPNLDIEIKYTGIRPGEKLFEELFYNEENRLNTDCKSIMLAQSSSINNIRELIEIIQNAVSEYDNNKLLDLIKNNVPEYKS